MTITISQLANLSAVLGNVFIPMVSNVAGTLTTVKGNVEQLQTYVLGTLPTDLANTEANVSSLQGNVSTLLSDVSNITDGTAVFGNLVPSANVTYSLGSETAQWKDLYLSGSTIYIGGATLTVANGAVESSLPISADITANTLNVADTQLTFSQGSYIDETEVVGQPGVYGLALNSPDDGIVGMNAIDSNANVTSSMIVSNVSAQINVANVTYGEPPMVWAFFQDGSISFPDTTSQYTAWTGTIDTGNVTGLSSVATSGDYSDLANAPVLGNVALSDDYNDLSNTPVLANVAISGDYDDLINTPNLSALGDFIMGNVTHWTSNVFTFEQAVNQLAERIYNIENP